MIPNLFFPTKEFRFREVFYCFRFWWKFDLILYKQAGTGPSRCHIQGSKIATGLQNFKVLKNFFEVSMPKKNWKGGPFGIFQHPFCYKTPKKIEGGTLSLGTFLKKVAQCRKNLKGPFGLVRYCMLRGKPFWFSSLGQQVHFGAFWKFCGTFGRTILVSSGGLEKTLTKSHDYSRLFSRKAPPKNEDP